MYNYKLVQKANPKDRNQTKKWYAIPVSNDAQTVKAMTRAATENTTTAPIEMESALELLGKYAIEQLLQGHSVRVGSLGTLRITFKSNGIDSLDAANAVSPANLIKNPRIIFTPSKELRDEVTGKLQFQNSGVLEDGISYASLTDYRRAKGVIIGGGSGSGSGSGSGGGGDDDQEENPLG
ncbi:MAG: hypothetical protein LUE99_18150 [Bacteroides sp.]|nr:hypothetical protein [Bacteroides sp.]